jgi:hypothetical protein
MSLYDCFQLALDVAEKAVLAKLAAKELPEPLSMGSSVAGVFLDVYLPVHLQQAYAQGAAAQLAEKPSGWMDDFGNAFPLGANKGAGSWMDAHKRTWKPLYTRREA